VSLSYKTITELVLLLGFVLLVMARDRNRPPRQGYLVALGVLAFGSLLPHVELLRSHANGQVHVHPTEFYHYYLGTKYFDEFGYYGLYEAAVVAEYEIDQLHFRPEQTIRHLRNPEFEIRKSDVLRRQASIKARFDQTRWREFKSDLAFFRTFNLGVWGRSPPERDHGYNGTPLTTALLGFVSDQRLLPSSTFISVAAWFDLALIAALTLTFGRFFGWEVSFAFLALWSLNPLNDFAYTGGAYLRHSYFVTLALGVALFARGKLVSSASALAASVGFRIFPGVFPAAIAAHDLVNRDPIGRVRRHWRFYASLVLAGVLLLGATWLVRTPDGRSSWLTFSERITRHAASLSPNRIGLRYLFSYSAEQDLDPYAESNPAGSSLDWRAEMQRTFEDRKFGYYAVAALGILASLAFLRSVPAAQAPFAGLVWLYLLAFPSHYYYGVLGIAPLVFAGDRRVWLLFAGLSASLLVLESTDAIVRSETLEYAAYSAAVGVFLFAVMALTIGGPRTFWARIHDRSSDPESSGGRSPGPGSSAA